jgi:thiol-disulfide isomerase/thioredoxin
MKALLTLAMLLVLAGCSTGSGAVSVVNGGEFRFVAGTPAGTAIAVDKRAPAPKFSGKLVGGGNFTSSTLGGKVAVLNFWGSWCAPCRVETPQFQQVYAAVHAQGVEFVGLDVKEPTEAFALAFMKRFGISYPSVYDPRGEVALAFRDYPANAIPSTIVLDRKQRVAAVYTGTVAERDLRSVLDRVLKEG